MDFSDWSWWMRRLTIVLVLCFTASLVACGSPEAQRADRAVTSKLSAAAEKSAAAGAARVVMHGTQELPGLGKPAHSSGFGVVDPSTQRLRLVMDLGESDATGDMGSAVIIGDGLIMYMKAELFHSVMPADVKPWLKMDLDAIGQELGIDMGSLMQLSSKDPSQTLNMLRGAAEVEKVGREVVQGFKTTHYKAIIDFRLVAESAPPDLRDTLSSSMDRLIELTGQETMPVETWVDDDGLVRRIKATVDLTETDPELGMPAMKMIDTTEYVEYGVEARIKIPPASRVTDMLEYIKELEGGASY